MKYWVHIPQNNIYYFGRYTKSFCFMIGAIPFLFCFISGVMLCSMRQYLPGLLLICIGAAALAIAVSIPSFLWYYDRIVLKNTYLKQISKAKRVNYNEIDQLYIGSFVPQRGVQDHEDELWKEEFGDYIIGKDRRGNIKFTMSFQLDAWKFLIEKCVKTASFVGNEKQLFNYMLERKLNEQRKEERINKVRFM